MLSEYWKPQSDKGPLKMLKVMPKDNWEVKPDSMVDAGHRFRIRCDYPMMILGHICAESRRRVGRMYKEDKLNVSTQLAEPQRTDDEDTRLLARMGPAYSSTASSIYRGHATSIEGGRASSKAESSASKSWMDSRGGSNTVTGMTDSRTARKRVRRESEDEWGRERYAAAVRARVKGPHGYGW